LKVLILGGRGFIGKHIKNNLKNNEVYTFDRHEGEKNHIRGNIKNLPKLEFVFREMDIIINLIGLTPLKNIPLSTYYKIHVNGVNNIIKASKNNHIKKLIHISALGANKESDIKYLKTKGLGEELIIKSGLNTNIFCPSIILGIENELVKLIKKYAFIRLFPNIKAKVQPIIVDDVSKLVCLSLENKIKEKKIEIGGPEKISIFHLAKRIFEKKGYKCKAIPESLVNSGMKIASIVNLMGIGKDQIRNIQMDNITENNIAKKYIELMSIDEWLDKFEKKL